MDSYNFVYGPVSVGSFKQQNNIRYLTYGQDVPYQIAFKEPMIPELETYKSLVVFFPESMN